MKWTSHPLKCDTVEFTWLDLFRMMLGQELRDSALIARRARKSA